MAASMQEQLTAQKTGKGNKEVDVLAVATTLIMIKTQLLSITFLCSYTSETEAVSHL